MYLNFNKVYIVRKPCILQVTETKTSHTDNLSTQLAKTQP